MNHSTRTFFLAALIAAGCAGAQAQFKEIKAAPFSPTVARQRIRAQLASANDANRDQVVATISGWLDWYRDILDEELIARWKSDARDNVPLVMAPLADARVAREVVEYSWHAGRAAAFTLSAAPMLTDLMGRYPASGQPLLTDLLPPAPAPELQPAEALTLCRILADMPDIGTWHKSALLILPRYRAAIDQLTKQDINSPDQEKSWRAQRWRNELKLDPPPPVSSTRAMPRLPLPSLAGNSPARPHIVGQPVVASSAYTGPMSGTYESVGGPIPADGEYKFANIPPVKLLLDFDQKHWEARLEPDEGGTQVLVMHNKGKGAQKKCVVRWSVIE